MGLDEVAHAVAVDAVAIADSKEVETKISVEIWLDQIHILVRLARITRLMSATCCKGKLGDAVEALGGLAHGAVLEQRLSLAILLSGPIELSSEVIVQAHSRLHVVLLEDV